MTSTQSLTLLIGAPLLAVVFGLSLRARPTLVIVTAVLAELIGYAILLWWGHRLLGGMSAAHRAVVIGYRPFDWKSRLFVLAVLSLFAAIVAGLGLGVSQLIRRGSA